MAEVDGPKGAGMLSGGAGPWAAAKRPDDPVEVVRGVARGVVRGVTPDRRREAHIARHTADRGAGEILRSPRHLEVSHES